ncbi:MAG: FMN-binding protein [Desulfosalsimonadaceae bacterium]|nr:FMN-binding protein [Desulfosalsimonadaceae bacterium]
MSTTQQTAPGVNMRAKDSFISQAWLVLVLATFFGATLAGVQLTLAPKIEANKLNETREKVPELVLGVAAAQTMASRNRQMEIKQQFLETGTRQKKTYSVFKAVADGRTAGWVVKTSGQGYADKIELLIGVDAGARTITGLFVLWQKETPGLGSKITEPAWRDQFIGKMSDQHLKAVKTKASKPNEINAITGATISSRSVCDIVNQSLGDLRQPLADMAAAKSGAEDTQQEKK